MCHWLRITDVDSVIPGKILEFKGLRDTIQAWKLKVYIYKINKNHRDCKSYLQHWSSKHSYTLWREKHWATRILYQVHI